MPDTWSKLSIWKKTAVACGNVELSMELDASHRSIRCRPCSMRRMWRTEPVWLASGRDGGDHAVSAHAGDDHSRGLVAGSRWCFRVDSSGTHQKRPRGAGPSLATGVGAPGLGAPRRGEGGPKPSNADGTGSGNDPAPDGAHDRYFGSDSRLLDGGRQGRHAVVRRFDGGPRLADCRPIVGCQQAFPVARAA